MITLLFRCGAPASVTFPLGAALDMLLVLIWFQYTRS